jgi:hypothetical protein
MICVRMAVVITSWLEARACACRHGSTNPQWHVMSQQAAAGPVAHCYCMLHLMHHCMKHISHCGNAVVAAPALRTLLLLPVVQCGQL